MAKIFKPRRALRSSVKSGSKRTLVLASGELMLVGKSAIGESSRADLYLGDGVSQMQNLSPAIYGDTSEEDITITDDTSTTASAALGNVTTGKTLGAILGSLKKAISLNAAAITTLNDERKTISMQENSLSYIKMYKNVFFTCRIEYKNGTNEYPVIRLPKPLIINSPILFRHGSTNKYGICSVTYKDGYDYLFVSFEYFFYCGGATIPDFTVRVTGNYMSSE